MNRDTSRVGARDAAAPLPAKTFPDWAPKLVVRYHYEECRCNDPAFYFGTPPETLHSDWRPPFRLSLGLLEMATLADRWCSGIDMEKHVWPQIKAKVPHDQFEDAAYYLTTQAITYLAYFREAMKKTHKQRQEGYQRIQSAAAELIAAIEDVPHFRFIHPFTLLSHTELEKLVHNAAHLAGFNGDSTGAIQVDQVRVGQYEKNYWKFADVVGMSVPTVNELLERLHDDAVRVATYDDNTQHTAGDKAPINFFLKHMTKEFVTKFGAAMDETLATFASVTFDDPSIDASRISTIRGRDR
jgi:hypothetical protein